MRSPRACRRGWPFRSQSLPETLASISAFCHPPPVDHCPDHEGFAFRGERSFQAVKSSVQVAHVAAFGDTIIRNTKLSKFQGLSGVDQRAALCLAFLFRVADHAMPWPVCLPAKQWHSNFESRVCRVICGWPLPVFGYVLQIQRSR